MVEVPFDDLIGHLFLIPFSCDPLASRVVSTICGGHLPHGVLSHVWPLCCPSMAVLVEATVVLVFLVAVDWCHFVLLLVIKIMLLLSVIPWLQVNSL